MIDREIAETHAGRIYQLHQVRSIVTQSEELARVLERAGKLLNNSIGVDDRSRKLLRQSWEAAGELFSHLDNLLHHGEVGVYPLQIESGMEIETNYTQVSDVLRELWSKIEWLQDQGRASQVRFSLERISQELAEQAQRLKELIDSAPQPSAGSAN